MSDPSFRKPKSAKTIELRNKAKREGWYPYIRQGEGEEADEIAMRNGCWFDVRRADHVTEFFERYGVLTEGDWLGKPFTLLDWQTKWLQGGFGWVRYSPEWQKVVRRYRYLYLEVPKKSGKTPLIATLGNYLLFADSPRRQVNQFLAATTRKQAERCLMHAIRAYSYRDDFKKNSITKKNEGFHSVEAYGRNNWTVLAADPASSDGINGHVLADELHRWIGHEFFNTLRWALASQPEGLFVGITTAGSDLESVCRSCHEKTIEVNTGRQKDDQWFGTIYAASIDDDPHDETTWFKANPSLGTKPHFPLKLESFRADYEAARNDPSQWEIWKQLRLDIWRTSENSWMPMEKWDAGSIVRENATERIDCFEDYEEDSFDWPSLNSVMAFDGATTRDTTAACFTFEHPTDDGVLITLPFYWLPEVRAEELADRVSFRHWHESGLIRLTPGDAVDFDFVFADLVELVNRFGIQEFYFDPIFQAEWLTQKLESETGAVRFEFPQTIVNFSPAMKTAERMIHSKTLRHNGNPIFNWQFGNMKSKSDPSGNIRPVKQKHGDYRTIDGVVAMLMTIRKWCSIENPDWYDDNEFESG